MVICLDAIDFAIEPKNHRWSLNVRIMALYGAYFINADSFTDIDHVYTGIHWPLSVHDG